IAVAGYVADDQPRMHRQQRVRAQTQASRSAGREILDEYVSARDEPGEDIFRCRMLDVEGEALLGAIQPDEVRAQALHRRVVIAREIAYLRPLDLDHASAQIRKLPRSKRRRYGLFQRDDSDSVEGTHEKVESTGRKSGLPGSLRIYRLTTGVGHLECKSEAREIFARVVIGIGELRQPVVVRPDFFPLIDSGIKVDEVPTGLPGRLHDDFDIALAVEGAGIAAYRFFLENRL